MSKLKKLKKPLSKKFVFRTAVVLICLAVLAAGTVSYAKYFSFFEKNSSASVANVGIEVFEINKYGSLATNIDFSQIVPGADIPGPHIKLKMNSEVNWSLFVKVTERGFPVEEWLDDVPGNSISARVTVGKDENGDDIIQYHDVISYFMSENWERIDTVKEVDKKSGEIYYVKTYKYTSVFVAGKSYNFTNEEGKGEGEIALLAGDFIEVSQYYGDYNYGGYFDSGIDGKDPEYKPPHYQQSIKFGLKFETYIKQVQNAS